MKKSKKKKEEEKKVLKLQFKGFVSLIWSGFRADELQEVKTCLLSSEMAKLFQRLISKKSI